LRFQLLAEVYDEELFRKSLHELGMLFYRCVNAAKGEYELVYFSGSRIVKYAGAVKQELIDYIEAVGFPVEKVEIDESAGIIRVSQRPKGES